MADSKFSVSDLLAFEIMRAHEEDAPAKIEEIDDRLWDENSRQPGESKTDYFLKLAKKRSRLVAQSATGIGWPRFVGGTGLAIILVIGAVFGVLLYLTFNRGPLFQIDENNEMSTTWFVWMVSIQMVVLVLATLTFVGYWVNEFWKKLVGKKEGQENRSDHQEKWLSKLLSLATRIIACMLLFFISVFLWVTSWTKVNDHFFMTLIRMFKSTLWPRGGDTTGLFQMVAIGISTMGCLAWVVFSLVTFGQARIMMEMMDVPKIKSASSFLKEGEVNYSEEFYRSTVGRIFDLPTRALAESKAKAESERPSQVTADEIETELAFLWRDFMRSTLWSTILVPRLILALIGILTFGHVWRRRGPFLLARYTSDLQGLLAPETKADFVDEQTVGVADTPSAHERQKEATDSHGDSSPQNLVEEFDSNTDSNTSQSEEKEPEKTDSTAAEAKAIDLKPSQPRPSQPKQFEPKSNAAKSNDGKSNDAKSVKPSSVEAKPVDSKSIDSKPVDSKQVKQLPADPNAVAPNVAPTPVPLKPTESSSPSKTVPASDRQTSEALPTEPPPIDLANAVPKKLWLCGYKCWPEKSEQLSLLTGHLPTIEKPEFGSVQSTAELIDEIESFGSHETAVLLVCSATKTPDRRLKATCQKIIDAIPTTGNFRFLLSDSGKLQTMFRDNPKYIEERIQSWHKVLMELGLKRSCLEEADLNLLTSASERVVTQWMSQWLGGAKNSSGNPKSFTFANHYTSVFGQIKSVASGLNVADGDALQSAWDRLREEIERVYKEQRQSLLSQLTETTVSGKDLAENVGKAAMVGLDKAKQSFDYLKLLKELPKEWMVGGAIVGGVLGIGATALAASASPAIAAATGLYMVAGNAAAGGATPVALKYLKSKLGLKSKTKKPVDQPEKDSSPQDGSAAETSEEENGFTLDDFFRSALFYTLLLELQGNGIDVINRELNSKLNDIQTKPIETADEGIELLTRVKKELDKDWVKRRKSQ